MLQIELQFLWEIALENKEIAKVSDERKE